MKKRKTWKIIFIVVFLVAVLSGIYIYQKKYQSQDFLEKTEKEIWDNLPEIFSGEPKEVRELRKKQTASSDKGRQEYYFNLLNEEEKKGYREILEGVRAREKELIVLYFPNVPVCTPLYVAPIDSAASSTRIALCFLITAFNSSTFPGVP